MKTKTRTKVVQVTKRDIACGVRNSVCNCPVARAVRRATRRKDGVSVDYTFIEVKGFQPVQHPKRVESFIDRFEEGYSVKPFSFTLRLTRSE